MSVQIESGALKLNNDDARKRALALLEKVGIGDKADSYPE